ncbi:unnamed protein product [Gongylonema pulchrum]|uniref:Uncharacterized protein n=1 Tax=Gongylonema pulchrum TaxID=637853 RepID=A0A183DGB7_9BILA|nr:unnamed protein product [Gongylonema pulchrum]
MTILGLLAIFGLIVSYSSASDSTDQLEDHIRNKRLIDSSMYPYWRQFQRNRQVMHQPMVVPRRSFFGFVDPSRPLFMRAQRTYLYDIDD